jgi:iron complex outermembrane receptor protein
LRPFRKQRAALSLALLLCLSDARGVEPVRDLATLSLEQLSDIEITSVSGYAEQVSDAPASVYVITADDIRRSGARSLPEALRLAPNLQVARQSASSYAITARGMNNAGNKLLVLLDGRILYTPLYSGVVWYAQDVMLEDVERIEVISGPGGTLWGSNAVNGVINVITRPAGDTQGALVAAGSGSSDRSFAARYGTRVGGSSVRIYARTLTERQTFRSNGAPVVDGRERFEAGFRADTDAGLTVQGGAYRGHLDQPGREAALFSGANLRSAWSKRLAGGGNVRVSVQADGSALEMHVTPIAEAEEART